MNESENEKGAVEQSDRSRLQWMQKVNTLHRSFETLYVVDGYQVVIVWDGEPISDAYHGETLDQAIDKAMADFDLEARPQWKGYAVRAREPLQLQDSRDQLLAVLRDAVNYLDVNIQSAICSSSNLHNKMRAAIAAAGGAA